MNHTKVYRVNWIRVPRSKGKGRTKEPKLIKVVQPTTIRLKGHKYLQRSQKKELQHGQVAQVGVPPERQEEA